MSECLNRKQLFERGFVLLQDKNPEIWMLSNDENKIEEIYIYYLENNKHLKGIDYPTRIEFLDDVTKAMKALR